jgi:hypothetical protein
VNIGWSRILDSPRVARAQLRVGSDGCMAVLAPTLIETSRRRFPPPAALTRAQNGGSAGLRAERGISANVPPSERAALAYEGAGRP